MKESSLVRRYAKALVLTLDDESEFRRVGDDLRSVLALLDADERLRIGLSTFMISLPEKISALNIIRDKMNLHEKTFRFLHTVAGENRFAFLEQIVQQLPDAWCAVHGIEKITVFSAIELAGDQKERLKGNLEKALRRPVSLLYRIDPALIAGISLQRGSLRYDFSLAGNLEKLRESLVLER